MLFLLGTNNKQQKPARKVENVDRVKELFNAGRFPVVTTEKLDDDRKVGKILGLVACRGFDSEEAFYGMAARAVNQGAQAIIGYQENIAFHPDGSKYFTCYGTAVQFESAQTSGAPVSASRQNTARALSVRA
jgi:hypothetical protein